MTPADVEPSLERIGAQTSVSRLLDVACTELVQLLGVRRVTLSRIIGDLLVEIGHHDSTGAELPPLELFLLDDYPLTQEVIESGEPRRVSGGDPAADPAETALLQRLGLDALLMLPLESRGQSWGLVEVYSDGGPLDDDGVARARTIVARVGELLAVIESR